MLAVAKKKTYDVPFLELLIGCQSCHSPGALLASGPLSGVVEIYWPFISLKLMNEART